MQKISNKEAGAAVTRRESFVGSNMFAEPTGRGVYVVYSYGYHFPMYAYDEKTDTFYGNAEKVSSSTGKQRAQAKPDKPIVWLKTTEEMMDKVEELGIAKLRAAA